MGYMPKFSLLMCVYEGDDNQSFEIALKSVTLEQTRPPTQVVLVIDGPISLEKKNIIDNVREAFPRVDVVKFEKNSGLVNALNAGIAHCNYEYIARMDSDDISHPNRFAKQLNLLENNPEIDVTSSYIQEFNEQGLSQIRKVPLLMKEITNWSKFRSPANHGACVYKKDAVLAVGGYSNYPQLQDYQLFVKLIMKGSIFQNTSDILLRVRMPDAYGRKVGLNYLIEELRLAIDFYSMGHIGLMGLMRNVVFRAFPRLLPAKFIEFIYLKIIR
jgi:glycosyltransferase involved in cell wall biosynthesis